jgi:hypothetical protein
MDVQTVTIDRDSAAEQLESYRSIAMPTEEERAIIAGLVAAAAGKPLVNLKDAIRGGGEFDDGCPRLAVMATDQRWCYATRSTNGFVTFKGEPHTLAQRLTFTVPGFASRSYADLNDADLISGWRQTRRTQVPIIPPQHRVRGWKTKCVVLWEVEEWARHLAPRPPGDPLLLRHLIDDLYSVEAVWDLTPLEQMVLGARS